MTVTDTGILRTLWATALAAILLCAHGAMAQTDAPDTQKKNARQLKSLTQNAIRLGDTHSALVYAAEWNKRSPESIKAAFAYAEVLRRTRNYPEAEKQYLRVLKAEAEKYPMALYHVADMQMSQGKYEEAAQHLARFRKVAREVKDERYRKLGLNAVASCEFAIALKDSARTALVASLGTDVNGPHVEFSPIPLGDTAIIYGSLNEDEVRYYSLETFDSLNIPLRKLYMAQRKGDKWVAQGELDGPFNSMGAHIGNAVLNGEGDRLYFTLCQKNWRMNTICQLYYADRKKDGGWKDAVKMDDEINQNNYTATQPAIGRESKKNREVLYFVSDRPKSRGGLDIWYTEYNKKKGTWGKPRNAGSKVNTAGTDCTPFYDLSTHSLYFSSDGHPGLGGLDVFRAVGEKSKWEEPVNLRADINSPADDIDFALRPDRKGGYLVSNRKGGTSLLHETCCDDLYEFRFLEHVEILAKMAMTSEDDCLTGVELFVHIIDPETGEKYLAERQMADDCHHTLQLEQGHLYRIEGKKDGHWTDAVDISTKELKASETFERALDLERIPEKPIVLDGILYEYNSADLTADARNTIDTTLLLIMQRNADIIIELGSHTDSRGTDEYNLRLSQRRAQSVVKYLTGKGISEKRLKAVGHGETQPIAPNEHPDRTDNPEGRAMNRRTDFRIIGTIDPEDLD